MPTNTHNSGNHSAKNTQNGRLYFGNKDVDYLNKMSRQAVEEHHNAPILYFEIDWEESKRNFYGEMIVKKFKNPKGLEVRGAIKMEQSPESDLSGIPYKVMKLVVSVYVDMLKELFIEPKLGDYFSIGNRMYMIYDKTIPDAGPGNTLMNRKRMRADYNCLMEDSETFSTPDLWNQEDTGYESDIKPGNSDV